MSTNTEFSTILEKLDSIDKQFQALSEKINELDKRCLAIESSTDRMDAHIDFVTRTYMYLRSPLMTLKGVTNRIGSVFSSAHGAPHPQAIMGTETDNATQFNDNGKSKHNDNELPLPPINQFE